MFLKYRRPPGLCSSCQHGLVIEGDTESKILRFCNSCGNSTPILWPVEKCTDYLERNRMDRYQAEKIGWVLELDKRGKVTGFAPPPKDKDS